VNPTVGEQSPIRSASVAQSPIRSASVAQSPSRSASVAQSPIRSASVAQYELSAGDYHAYITKVGAGLRTLTYAGRDLVVPDPLGATTSLYRGAVLAPWPNRVARGHYVFAGTEHRLPITEPARNSALHGLVHDLVWTLLEHSEQHALLELHLRPVDGYPFDLMIRANYRLDAVAGLRIVIGAENLGAGAAPYGCSIHPYLIAGKGLVNDWTFQLPAGEVETVDPATLVPESTESVDGTRFDFQVARSIDDVQVDHALTGIEFDARGQASAQVRSADGSGVEISWDTNCRWVQVHTADRPEPEFNRVGLAVEPMTCPPDAFNSGAGLVVLEPGGALEVAFRIAAL
jgi:aldose 1-epimerase